MFQSPVGFVCTKRDGSGHKSLYSGSAWYLEKIMGMFYIHKYLSFIRNHHAIRYCQDMGIGLLTL